MEDRGSDSTGAARNLAVSDAEKAFDPTPQRIERAKREGDVARSGELGANLAFAAAALAVVAVSPWIEATTSDAITTAAAGQFPWSSVAAVITYALVPIACAAPAAIAATFIQTGGLHVTPVTVKLERIDPLQGLKRIASRETLSHALRAGVAFVVASLAMLPALSEAMSRLLTAAGAEPVGAAVWSAVQRVSFAAAATGSLFALGEYAAARSAWLRKLRMSFDERKREAKEQEGDPFARGRRRALYRSLSRGAIAKVKDAAFVVVNPSHVAVALEYEPPKIPVPVVIVRAAGEVALRVRVLAENHGVTVIENVTLARALYFDSQVGLPIARAHYVAVAEIVAALRRTAKEA